MVALLPASDPIHKATIIPRGRALGTVMRLPEGDRISLAREQIYADLRVACGGRIAEELIFGEERVTTGASSDIRMATDMARRMVTEWGMSDKLGFLAYNAMNRKCSSAGGGAAEECRRRDGVDDRFRDPPHRRRGLFGSDEDPEEEQQAARAAGAGASRIRTLNGDEIKIIVEGGTLSREDSADEVETPQASASAPRSPAPAGRKAPAAKARAASHLTHNGPHGCPT